MSTSLQSTSQLRPIKVMDVELSNPIGDLEGLYGYDRVQVLVRLHGAPLGYVQLPLAEGRCSAVALSKALLEHLSWPIIRHLISDGLGAPSPTSLRIADLVQVQHPTYAGPWPSVSVAVCTRDRVDDLTLCLQALCRLDYPNLEVLVVDNAPQTEATAQLVRTRFPQVRYVREPRPGLSWARNRAIAEAQGTIIAYTDDDVVVDAGWVHALAQVFAENPEVMAVTGLVVPYELETDSQLLFERHGGFGRGFERKRYQGVQKGDNYTADHLGAGKFGTGANMAYRRSLFTQIGPFDPALGAGTPTNGGEDLEMFFRMLQEGHALVYEPNALVRHRHRRDYASLRSQIANNGVALFAYYVRSSLAYPHQRAAFMRLARWWLWRWHIKRLVKSYIRPQRFPRDLILAELWGCFVGLTRYPLAQFSTKKIIRQFGPMTSPTSRLRPRLLER